MKMHHPFEKWTLLFLLLAARSLPAQITPTVQDCLGAIPICQQIYSETLSPTGDGNYNNEVNPNNNCTEGEINSIWYKFTVDQSGDFGFLITPNDLNDDYDWSLFNITNASCSDIFTNQSLMVSCNAAGSFPPNNTCNGLTGATGASIYNIQGGGCNAITPNIAVGSTPFNDLIPVVAGNTYVLMVSNWTGSNNGYTIDFGLSTGIGIIDNTPPSIVTGTGPTSCGGQAIDLFFSEYLDCPTVDDSNFQLSGPGGPYTLSLTANACDNSNGFDNTLSLVIDPPISSLGTYTLTITSQGPFPFQDICGNPIGQDTITFDVTVPIEIDVNIGGDTSIVCEGDVLPLSAFTQGGSYIWQDGTTDPVYFVTLAGVYSVTVTDACGSGSDSIGVTVLMEPPQFDLGGPQVLCNGESTTLDASTPFSTYAWQDGSTLPTFTTNQEGTYTVVVTNACGSATDQVFLNAVPPVNLDLGGDQVACAGDVVVLDATNQEATYLWQDGSTGPTLEVTENGIYEVTVVTLCESQSEEVEVLFISETAPELGQDTFLCAGDTIFLDATLPGASGYLWQDGNTGPVYAATEGGDFSVEITTVCNTFQDELYIYFIPYIQFDLGRDTFLCESQLFLNAGTEGPAEYEWQDGFDKAYYVVEKPGIYQVRVFNACESVSDTIYIKECENCSFFYPNVFSPNFDGINDRFVPQGECPFEQFELKVFDRWGALVFESRDPQMGWDGTFKGRAVNAGAYSWWMEFTVLENGRPRSDIATGSVVVVR